jgi:tetratricopeptide (TPR) repeat protein
MLKLFLLTVMTIQLGACHTARRPVDHGLRGPASTQLDLYRNPASQNKIFIEARLSDGTPRLFLVDTGSGLTVISHALALELDLPITPRPGQLVGVGGMTRWMGAILPSLRLGAFSFSDIPVAVGVSGIPTHVGVVPLAGIIGSDVLAHFQVVIDYPANEIKLARPGTFPTPEHAVALFVQEKHPLIQTTLTARDQTGTTIEQPVLLEIDTGAKGLLLMGGSETNLSSVSSQGVEPVIGVGSDSTLPLSNNLKNTRRIPIVRFSFGGRVIEEEQQALWVDYDRPRRRHSPGMPGIAGYQVFRNYRLFLDYPGRAMALLDSTQAEAITDVHEWFLRRSGIHADSIDRVRALFIMGRTEEAVRKLERLARNPTAHPAAVALLARNYRATGQADAAHTLLSTLSIRDLVEQNEIVGWVNGLWLHGNPDLAMEQALLATVLKPESSQSWIALADAALATEKFFQARFAITEAVRLDANPDAHLLRRAFIAMQDSDQAGAMTHLRRLIRLHPGGGYAHWLYSLLASDNERAILVRNDIVDAEKRLHPGDGPHDFLAGAWAKLDDEERAGTHFQTGLQRDCARAPDIPSQHNCTAWYHALVRKDLPTAHELVHIALESRPNRAEYLDTLAVVLEAQGQLKAAKEAAWKAARQSPADVYLFTQALRLEAVLTHQ